MRGTNIQTIRRPLVTPALPINRRTRMPLFRRPSLSATASPRGSEADTVFPNRGCVPKTRSGSRPTLRATLFVTHPVTSCPMIRSCSCSAIVLFRGSVDQLVDGKGEQFGRRREKGHGSDRSMTVLGE